MILAWGTGKETDANVMRIGGGGNGGRVGRQTDWLVAIALGGEKGGSCCFTGPDLEGEKPSNK